MTKPCWDVQVHFRVRAETGMDAEHIIRFALESRAIANEPTIEKTSIARWEKLAVPNIGRAPSTE